MYVIPQVPVVRDPDRFFAPLPPEGAEVTSSRYWRRRLKDGNIRLGEPPHLKKSNPKKPEAADKQ